MSANAECTTFGARAAKSAVPATRIANSQKAIWTPNSCPSFDDWSSDLPLHGRYAQLVPLLPLLLVETPRLEVVDLLRRLRRLLLDGEAAFMEMHDHLVARVPRQAVPLAELDALGRAGRDAQRAEE